MKVWAQDEFDLVKTGADGQYRFGKGDFRRVNMRGHTRLIIGAACWAKPTSGQTARSVRTATLTRAR